MIFIDEKEGIAELKIGTFMVYSILFNEICLFALFFTEKYCKILPTFF